MILLLSVVGTVKNKSRYYNATAQNHILSSLKRGTRIEQRPMARKGEKEKDYSLMSYNTAKTNTPPICINYSDARLRVLVEEYITQQRGIFSLQGACAYVLYWAMEDGHTLPAAGTLYQNDKLLPADCQRVSAVLQKIVQEGRIVADGDAYRQVMN